MSTSAASASSTGAPAVPASVLAEHAKIRALIASNLYDTKIVGALEDHVKYQLKTGSYDGESNRELLKLYAVAPDMIKLDILSRLLLKALMELPSPDFFTSMYLVNESLHTLEPLKVLLKLHNLLETCQFKKFWKEVDSFKANAANAAVLNFAEVADFDAAIRRFVSRTVSATYSSITTTLLKELWNANDKAVFEQLVAAAGWTLTEEGKTVQIRALPSAASKDAKPETQRQDYPSMEALAKLVTHVV